MKKTKSLASLLLTLCLLLSLLPAALAVEQVNVPSSVTWTYTTLDGRTITQDTYKGKVQVLVFYNVTGGCLNSNRTIPALASASWASGGDVQVIAIGCPGYVDGQRVSPSEDLVRSYADTYAPGSSIVFAWSYDPMYNGASQAIKYMKAAGLKDSSDNSVLYATTIVLDQSGNIRYGWDGGYDAAAYTTAVNALTGGDPGTETPEEPGGQIQLTYDSSVSDEEWEVLRLTNIHRMSMGLSPLSTSDKMQQAGNQRAQELTVLYASDHSRPDGSRCFTVLEDYGISYRTAAENIAYGYGSAQAVMNGWLNSSGHRANIENAALTHMGVGCAQGDRLYWAQHFVGSSCAYSNLSLSSSTLSLGGRDLEEALAAANITVTATCSVHGRCKLPLIAAMCSGYDSSASGTQTVTVTLGGASATLEIQGACDHRYGDWQVTIEPTCTDTGTEVRICALCGEREVRTLSASGHQYDDGEVTREPTCTREGQRTYTCIVCGAEKQESIPKTDHQPDRDGICTVCGQQVAEPQPGEDSDLPFTDVAGHWALEGISYVWEQGLMNGTSDTTFAPGMPLSRAMLVQILYNLEGRPSSSNVVLSEITDVPRDAWYRKAVAWAMELGIVEGNDQHQFLPEQPITREQMATILYRYVWERGYDGGVSGVSDFNKYPDRYDTSNYAFEATMWAVERGLLTGNDQGLLQPKGSADRAQSATILMRFCQNVLPQWVLE